MKRDMKMNGIGSIVKRKISVIAILIGLAGALIVPACNKDDDTPVPASRTSSIQSTPQTTNWANPNNLNNSGTTAGVGASSTSASTTYSTTSVTSASTYGYGGGQTSSTSGSPISTGLPPNGGTNGATTTGNNPETTR